MHDTELLSATNAPSRPLPNCGRLRRAHREAARAHPALRVRVRTRCGASETGRPPSPLASPGPGSKVRLLRPPPQLAGPYSHLDLCPPPARDLGHLGRRKPCGGGGAGEREAPACSFPASTLPCRDSEGTLPNRTPTRVQPECGEAPREAPAQQFRLPPRAGPSTRVPAAPG